MRKHYADVFQLVYFRFLSPLFHTLAIVGAGPASGCRFEPTCGRYCEAALRRHGLVRGVWMTLWRLVRCNPLSKGGWDPLPPDTQREIS